jgi:hypothetical protein
MWARSPRVYLGVSSARSGPLSLKKHALVKGHFAWRFLSFRMSPLGTFETCRGNLTMSVHRRRPEVAGRGSIAAAGRMVRGWFRGDRLSAFVKIILWIVALSAWCGAIWSNFRVAKQLRAAGHSIWTFDHSARWNAWKGTNIVFFLSWGAIFAAAVLALIAMQ